MANRVQGVASAQGNASVGKQCVPMLSFMKGAMSASYTEAQMLASSADISFMSLASGGYLMLSINSPFDIVLKLPSSTDHSMTLQAPINHNTGSGAGYASTTVQFEINQRSCRQHFERRDGLS